MDIDLLRIKIWDAAMDEMIYDSKLGIGDGDDQGIALGGGAVRIHTSELDRKSRVNSKETMNISICGLLF